MDKIATIKQILTKAICACDLSGLAEVQGVVITRQDALMIIGLLTELEQKECAKCQTN